MTSLPPPTYYFSGINFNTSFYTTTTTTGSGLTLAQANSLYLEKTAADTATALETFSAGMSGK